MSFKGNLHEIGLKRLIERIRLDRQTGALCIQSDDNTKTAYLYFKAGMLIYVARVGNPMCLTDMMVHAGKLAPDQAKIVRANVQTDSDKELGLWMIHKGILDRNDIIQGLQTWLLESVRDLIIWTGTYQFEENRLPPQDRATIAIDLDQVISLIDRETQAWKNLRNAFPNLDVTLRFKRADADWHNANLDVAHWKIIPFIKRGKTLYQIMLALNLDEFQIRRIAHDLASAELVEVSPSSLPVPQTLAIDQRMVARPRLRTSLNPALHATLRQLGTSLGTLLVILYLTVFGLILAERGALKLPTDPPSAAMEALAKSIAFIFNHPATYYWHKENTPALVMIASIFANSAGLLFVALGLATCLGAPLGIAMALTRRFRTTTVVLLFSVLAVSMPSFFLGMLLWVLNAQIYRQFEIPGLPAAGFGWDAHVIMPALVLATRPFAQVVQMTYVTVVDVLREDFIRTAQSKGLRQRVILMRHTLRNAAVPILTTLSTSLRYSLASLPVVEFFFNWPGVGWTLLQSIDARQPVLTVDLMISLGLLFLLIHSFLDFLYRLIDPRLRTSSAYLEENEGPPSLRAQLSNAWNTLVDWVRHWQLSFTHPPRATSKTQPQITPVKPTTADHIGSTYGRIVRAALNNPAFIIGTLLVIAFLSLALFGDLLTLNNPYATHSGITKVDGDLRAPPFAPTLSFPWGSDLVGRDIQALIFAGAKQTFALALFGAFARVLVGTLIGAFAAWWQHSWFDRLIMGAIGVWAAFPATLFAMILILALGIQQGMWVFIIALCTVGWSEIAQTVRSQVIVLKHRQFVEGARAVGTRSLGIVLHHFVPNLVPALLVLAVLELGGVMLLLAELGFLNIFLGGGFPVEIGQTGKMMPVIFYFSDVPEWGALLANIRNWWRSYPWLAWYPGLFFFVAILAFNLWGEGLRRFLEESRLNVSRLFNRFTLLAGVIIGLGLLWVLQTNAPTSLYAPQAKQFDPVRVMQDIRQLAAPEFQGRQAGTPGAKRAAEYIAQRMEQIGLMPGDQDSYVQSSNCSVFHLTQMPRLELLDAQDQVVESYVYRQDMVEYIGVSQSYGEGKGRVIGVALGPDPNASEEINRGDTTQAPIIGAVQGTDPYGLARLGLRDKIILVDESVSEQIRNPRVALGILVVTTDRAKLDQRFVYHRDGALGASPNPMMYITPAVADKLLHTAGANLDEFKQLQASLGTSAVALTKEGAIVNMAINGTFDMTETCYTVVGYLPGTGSLIRAPGAERGLDAQIIMVSTYYDGLGTGPEGQVYPSVNDNASGVAAMLEMAQVMKQGVYPPKKTLVFVAWSPGERGEGLSTWNVTQGSRSLNSLSVEAVVELSGVGAGNGTEIALGQGTSFRLVQLAQSVANQLGYGTTTRGRSPHFGMYGVPGFGGRAALSAHISWDGSDQNRHTPQDTLEAIDPMKIKKTGETTLLMLTILSRETEY